jgi:SAM-dependent MidA family methyltransferase
MVSGLPPPSPEAATHSELLTDLIRAEITRSGGGISFARFMELALYEPGLGYYSAGLTKFGPEGDFITAPEISPLFARCLARQCQQVLEGLDHGDILELGAGSGRLAAELLLELERLGALPRRYRILELSADLRARQQSHLQAAAPHLLSRVAWLNALPEPFTGLILANEVLDALPVRRFRKDREGLFELQVGWDGEGFCWKDTPAGMELTAAVETIENDLGAPLPPPYVSEVNLLLDPWIASLAEQLDRGVLLFIDYGYPRREFYHPERTEGTLICHYRHRAHADPFILPGLQDITAFVDFTAVAEAGHAHGLAVAGYTTQGYFLIACGLDKLLTELQSREPERYPEYAHQAKRLTLPGEMGERFKAIALTKGWEAPLLGFGLYDQRARL